MFYYLTKILENGNDDNKNGSNGNDDKGNGNDGNDGSGNSNKGSGSPNRRG